MDDHNDADELLAARLREYEDGIRYLHELALPEDQWIIQDERPWWKVSQLAERLGLNEQTIRAKLLDALRTNEAEGIPGGVLHSQQAGWSVARRGVVVYLARLRRAQRGQAAS